MELMIIMFIAILGIIFVAIASQSPTSKAKAYVKKTTFQLKKALEQLPSATTVWGDSKTSQLGEVGDNSNKVSFKMITTADTRIVVTGTPGNYVVVGTNAALDSRNQKYVYYSATNEYKWD